MIVEAGVVVAVALGAYALRGSSKLRNELKTVLENAVTKFEENSVGKTVSADVAAFVAEVKKFL